MRSLQTALHCTASSEVEEEVGQTFLRSAVESLAHQECQLRREKVKERKMRSEDWPYLVSVLTNCRHPNCPRPVVVEVSQLVGQLLELVRFQP